MMQPDFRRSIRWQLTRLMMATALLALLLTSSLLVGYEFFTARRALARDLERTADMVGVTTTAALQFDDRRAAQELLQNLKVDPQVVEGTLYDSRRRIRSATGIATRSRSPSPGPSPSSDPSSSTSSGSERSASWAT